MNEELNVSSGIYSEKSGIDVKAYTIPELEEIIEKVVTEIEEKREQKRKQLKERFEELASAEGFTVKEVLGRRASGAKGGGKKRGSPRVVKYRNPADSSQTWSGNGRHPGWVKEALNSGRSLSDFAV